MDHNRLDESNPPSPSQRVCQVSELTEAFAAQTGVNFMHLDAAFTEHVIMKTDTETAVAKIRVARRSGQTSIRTNRHSRIQSQAPLHNAPAFHMINLAEARPASTRRRLSHCDSLSLDR